jgi:CheY-like chemotaxis protein
MSHSVQKFVLYADDDTDDQSWVTEACKAVDARLSIYFVENGREALDYLQTLSQAQLPSLIILDLNMPKLDGRQTLQRLKADPLYQHIPVAIVSTSSSKMDKEVCQRLGASVFLVKPDSHQSWQNIIQQLMPLTAQ